MEREVLLRAACELLAARDEQVEILRYELWAAEVALQSRIEQEASSVEPTIKFEKQPLYLSEEQEDVQWQLDNDLISTKTAQALLKEMEFENAEVHLDEDYTYENYHF